MMRGTLAGQFLPEAGPDRDDRQAGPERSGERAMNRASARAARDGVGRGLRALYAESLDEPLPDEMRDLLERFAGPAA
jgi:hypothetical protein